MHIYFSGTHGKLCFTMKLYIIKSSGESKMQQLIHKYFSYQYMSLCNIQSADFTSFIYKKI